MEYLNFAKTKNIDIQYETLARLIQIMLDDKLINKKLIVMLQLDSYQRRLVLNNWLAQLRGQNAPLDLLNALAYPFDDTVAEQVLAFIHNHKI